jgi:predicted MFS family arabinose efflux permease
LLLINNDNDEIRNVEKKTFKLHVISQVFNGLSVGIVLLQDIILKKSLGGTDFQIMLLSLFTSSAFLASIYGAEFINRSDNPPRLIIKMGIAAKFFLLLIPIFNNSVFFIVCISITAYLDSMMLSSWNIVFKHNYTDANRNKLYSYATSVSTSILLVSSTIFGVLLDNDNFIYRLIFPLSGIAGMFMYYNLSKMIGLSLVKYPKVEQSANNFCLKIF